MTQSRAIEQAREYASLEKERDRERNAGNNRVSEPTDPRGFLFSRWFWPTCVLLLTVDAMILWSVLTPGQ